MSPKTEIFDDVAVVLLPLEKLDLSTTTDFKQAMAQVTAQHKKVVLNMENVGFVDSSGLGAMLSVLRELSGNSGDLKLCLVQKRVRVMFELVRMHRILTIFDTIDDALASFGVAKS